MSEDVLRAIVTSTERADVLFEPIQRQDRFIANN